MSAERPLRDRRKAGFSLIETMRWQPGGGLLRRDLHMARLAGSARALGFACSQQDAGAQLDAALENCTAPMRVRLELASDGHVSITTQPFIPPAADTVWRLCIASARLDSTDRLLRHKTSRRAIYEAARAEFSSEDADEVLLLNEKGEICEGTITSLFVETQDGALLTPALGCGLLDGVLRKELLLQGRAREAILSADDVLHARRIFVGNSLRGLVAARLPQAG